MRLSHASTKTSVLDVKIVFLHGFAGHADAFAELRASLRDRDTHALTLHGHDPLAPASETTTFDEEVDRVASAIRLLSEPVRLVGYSMGGRVALGVLTRAPELLSSLVLVGAHPGLDSDAERTARREADEIWARRLEREGIEAFVAAWQAQPLFASQERLSAQTLARQRALRLRHDPRSLALAMRSLGLGAMPSYWTTLGSATIPIELVVGSLDPKFSALAGRMRDAARTTSVAVHSIAGSGHNVVLEEPEQLARIVAAR